MSTNNITHTAGDVEASSEQHCDPLPPHPHHEGSWGSTMGEGQNGSGQPRAEEASSATDPAAFSAASAPPYPEEPSSSSQPPRNRCDNAPFNQEAEEGAGSEVESEGDAYDGEGYAAEGGGGGGGSNDDGADDDGRVTVHDHEPSPRIEGIDDVQAKATAPVLLSAARTLDVRIARVHRGRAYCASVLVVLALCLGLQGYAWIAYYQTTICDIRRTSPVVYDVGAGIRTLRAAVAAAAAEPGPIAGGQLLPASFGVDTTGVQSRGGFAAAAGGVVSKPAAVASEAYTVTLRNKDRPRGEPTDDSSDVVYPVAAFTSQFLEASVPYADLIAGGAAPLFPQIAFEFNAAADSSADFTRTVRLSGLSPSTLQQTVRVRARCFPSTGESMQPPQPQLASCDTAAMGVYCQVEYGSFAVWENTEGRTTDCPLYGTCGHCRYERYLAAYAAVIAKDGSGSASAQPPRAYGPDGSVASPLFPFNNANRPAVWVDPADDVSATFITPSTTATRTNVNGDAQGIPIVARGFEAAAAADLGASARFTYAARPAPTAVAIRVYQSADPLITLQRLTAGAGEFTSYENGADLAAAIAAAGGAGADPNTNPLPSDLLAPSEYYLLTRKKYPLGCGVPEMICAWGVFFLMFGYLILVCKRVPNFALEAEVTSEGVVVEYENYDAAEKWDDENENAETQNDNNNSNNTNGEEEEEDIVGATANAGSASINHAPFAGNAA